MNKELSTWPEQIYLQHGCDELRDYAEVRGSELTWCVDNINESDVHYIRADLAERAASNPASSAPVAAITDERAAFIAAAEREGWNVDQSSRGGFVSSDTRRAWEGWQLARAALSSAPMAQAEPFQQRVQPWMMECFGPMIAGDREERNHRFLEEALELVQSTGCTAHEAHQLVDYVFGRPVGEPAQEVGGVMVTLAALCLANGLDMHECGEVELARIWTKVEQIRAKQAAKPKHSPLPVAATPAVPAAPSERETHYGKDCPKGMVQIEFVGCSPKNRMGDYGWKPEKSAFLEVYVDGHRYRIEVGDFHDGKAQRRGLHIVTGTELCAEKTSTNAASIFLKSAAPAAPIERENGQ